MRTFAIACLLGLAAATKLNKPSGKPAVPGTPYEQAPFNAWDSVKDGAANGQYERVLTPHFSADADDIFMRSMIKKYAVEERTDKEMASDGQISGGEPTGIFWITPKEANWASHEVMKTHKGLSG